MAFNVYILYSATFDKYYVGMTGEDIIERIRKHNTNHSGYTSRHKDWRLIYKEEFQEGVIALKREKEIKSWKSRKKIEIIIKAS